MSFKEGNASRPLLIDRSGNVEHIGPRLSLLAVGASPGAAALAPGASAVAYGSGVSAGGGFSVAVGYNASTVSGLSVALGYQVTVSGSPAVGVGSTVTASGNGSVAVGLSATASATSAWAFGRFCSASATNAGVVGGNIVNGLANTVLIGANATEMLSIGTSYIYARGWIAHASGVQAVATNATLTNTEVRPDAVVHLTSGGAANLTLPTGANLDTVHVDRDTALIGNDMAFTWYVANDGTGAATLTASAGHTIEGNTTAAIAAGDTVTLFTRRTAAATYETRCVGRGTH